MPSAERVRGGHIGLRCVAAATAARRPYLMATIWLLAVAVRLVLINQPYTDHWSWRQSDVAAIARNFYHHGFHFAYPQIDWAGNAPGYVGTEFPILPFFAAICYKFLAVHEWIGRSQSVIFFAVSLPFFFLLVRQTFGSTAAVWATFFFSFTPLNIFAGRSFMPDVPSLGLALIGLYFLLLWARHCAWATFFLSAIAVSLSLLIKITSIVIAAPLLYLLTTRSTLSGSLQGEAICRSPQQRAKTAAPWEPSQTGLSASWLMAFAAIAILPSVAWYWHAYQVSQEFYPHHFFGAGGVRLENFYWYWNIARQIAVWSLTPVLAILALIGLFAAPRGRYGRLFDWWLVAMIFFVVLVGYGNRHRWYQLPLTPIAAAFAGAGCAWIGSKLASRAMAMALSIALAGSFAIISFVFVRPFYAPSAAQLRDAGLRLREITPPDALIVAADGGDPTLLYYAHRKGWHFLEKDAIYNGNPDDSQQAIADLETLRRRGATHLVFTTNTFWWLNYYPEFAQHLAEVATLVESRPEFRIYRLMPK
jgi:hypothetical protein